MEKNKEHDLHVLALKITTLTRCSAFLRMLNIKRDEVHDVLPFHLLKMPRTWDQQVQGKQLESNRDRVVGVQLLSSPCAFWSVGTVYYLIRKVATNFFNGLKIHRWQDPHHGDDGDMLC